MNKINSPSFAKKRLMVVKRQALAHYDRMIAWAKTQHPNSYPSKERMDRKIGEHWQGRFCAYCCYYNTDCRSCPLSPSPFGGCCGALWHLLNAASNWKLWIKAAKKVRAYIKRHG